MSCNYRTMVGFSWFLMVAANCKFWFESDSNPLIIQHSTLRGPSETYHQLEGLRLFKDAMTDTVAKSSVIQELYGRQMKFT